MTLHGMVHAGRAFGINMTVQEIKNRIERLKWLGKGDQEIVKLIASECKKGNITGKECNSMLETYGCYYDSLTENVEQGNYYCRNRVRLVWDINTNSKFFLQYVNGEVIGVKTRGNSIVEKYNLTSFKNVNDLETYVYEKIVRKKNYDRQSYREPDQNDIKFFYSLVG